MELEIQNIAKIKYANIKINGITVIAGNNNTGKSTVGKALFSIFNSVYRLNEKIYTSRCDALGEKYRRTLEKLPFLKNLSVHPTLSQSVMASHKLDLIVKDYTSLMKSNMDAVYDKEYIVQQLGLSAQKYGITLTATDRKEFFDKFAPEIDSISGTEDYDIATEIIERFFRGVFSEQINNLGNSDDGELTLDIHDKKIDISFKNNTCTYFNSEFNIMHEAFFIDDPFIIDELDDVWRKYFNGVPSIKDFLVRKITSVEHSEGLVVDSIQTKKKLKDIDSILNAVVPVQIQRINGKWKVVTGTYTKPLNLENTSAGVKSFLLLKLLLEKGILKEKDVLILDEPEIHLHPDWQIKYAEMIVLLQKAFDLSILVTTHSSEFFQAIELYSKKYGISEKFHSYLFSKQKSGKVEFSDVTDDITEVYRQLISPSRILDELKFTLEE